MSTKLVSIRNPATPAAASRLVAVTAAHWLARLPPRAAGSRLARLSRPGAMLAPGAWRTAPPAEPQEAPIDLMRSGL
jgi:hypothetical protein